jgi:ribosome biogenesis GTPase
MQLDLLKQYGWHSYSTDFKSKNNSLSLGRIVLQHRNKFRLISDSGEIWVRSAGNLFFSNKDDSGLPAVGDWVLYELQA